MPPPIPVHDHKPIWVAPGRPPIASCIEHYGLPLPSTGATPAAAR